MHNQILTAPQVCAKICGYDAVYMYVVSRFLIIFKKPFISASKN